MQKKTEESIVRIMLSVAITQCIGTTIILFITPNEFQIIVLVFVVLAIGVLLGSVIDYVLWCRYIDTLTEVDTNGKPLTNPVKRRGQK